MEKPSDVVSMNGPAAVVRMESRWPPALVIAGVVLLLAAWPGPVQMLPVWVAWAAVSLVLAAMAIVALTTGHERWVRLERAMVLLVASAYIHRHEVLQGP